MNQTSVAVSPSNGATPGQELFALTDEQILDIEPVVQDAEVQVGNALQSVSAGENSKADPSSPPAEAAGSARDDKPLNFNGVQAAEPPAWLVAEMKDPWVGDEARELWEGVVQARDEAAAYRAAIATPEDARTLKELYPGGFAEARAAAERARILDELDRAFFGTHGGATGGTPEQISAARAQLAQQLMQQDPAAFREMVQLGLRALEGLNVAPPFSAASAPAETQPHRQDAGPMPGPAQTSLQQSSAVAAQHSFASTPDRAAQLQTATSAAAPSDPAVAAYAAFERAANDDLERSVGSAIARTIEQALPNLSKAAAATAGTPQAVPLSDRLASAVRQDVETALKGDPQLGQQIAQILAARRFDDVTRAQVVRLIGGRAQQLVPGAARRVISEWTSATLAAHGAKSERTAAASSRREVAQAASGAASSVLTQDRRGIPRSADPARKDRTQPSRSVDYRKLSDEQILELYG